MSVLCTLVACVPAGPSTPPSVQRFCDLWEEVAEAPPAPDNPVEVSPDVVAFAEDAQQVGGDCSQPGARVDLDEAMVSEVLDPTEAPEVEFEDPEPDPAPEPDPTPVARAAALTNGADLGPGQVVMDNVALKALSLSVSANGIRVSGNVSMRLSGVTSTVGFVGTLSDLENWSLTLSSSALAIPGITTAPVVFSGTLRSVAGNPSLHLAASAPLLTIGDITVQGATINLAASPTNGVTASVQGAIRVGSSSVAGSVDVVFDSAGNLLKVDADVDVRLVGYYSGGSVIDLAGEVHMEGNGDDTVVSFSGGGVIGDLIVNGAHGDLDMTPNGARFTGLVDVEQQGSTVRFETTIVWDGIAAYVERMVAEADGQISGTLSDGRRIGVDGQMELILIDGHLRTIVTGDFQLGDVRASGTALVDATGSTTILEVDAEIDLDGDGADASIAGNVVIVDGRAELVELEGAVLAGEIQLGDLTLGSSTLRIRSEQGRPLDISVDGAMTIDVDGEDGLFNAADLHGTVALSIGPDGSLMSLEGTVGGTFDLDPVDLDVTAGKLSANGREVTADIAGNILLAGADIDVSGTFRASLQQPDWILRGSGKLHAGKITVTLPRVVVTPSDGIVSANIRARWGPAFVRGDLQFRPGGDKVFICTNGGPIARLVARNKFEDAGVRFERRGSVYAGLYWNGFYLPSG